MGVPRTSGLGTPRVLATGSVATSLSAGVRPLKAVGSRDPTPVGGGVVVGAQAADALPSTPAVGKPSLLATARHIGMLLAIPQTLSHDEGALGRSSASGPVSAGSFACALDRRTPPTDPLTPYAERTSHSAHLNPPRLSGSMASLIGGGGSPHHFHLRAGVPGSRLRMGPMAAVGDMSRSNDSSAVRSLPPHPPMPPMQQAGTRSPPPAGRGGSPAGHGVSPPGGASSAAAAVPYPPTPTTGSTLLHRGMLMPSARARRTVPILHVNALAPASTIVPSAMSSHGTPVRSGHHPAPARSEGAPTATTQRSESTEPRSPRTGV
eukprot:TRINITY_DN503_c0_g1_i1.p1 TRINITY_DN503_c0_g1~~TRINITY_DN503_c0_g1_i1.p1  ORF type:complete len:321 (-),score=25.37 TRINITY_DN503_c0_g1_i1:938-1900(-)